MSIRMRNDRGVALADILIFLVAAGLIMATVIPKLVEKKEAGQMELSRRNMKLLIQAEEAYHQAIGSYTSNLKKLEALTPELQGMKIPGRKEYSIALADPHTCVIVCPLGYGYAWADSAGTRFSWE